jgi:hypothetical protein
VNPVPEKVHNHRGGQDGGVLLRAGRADRTSAQFSFHGRMFNLIQSEATLNVIADGVRAMTFLPRSVFWGHVVCVCHMQY